MRFVGGSKRNLSKRANSKNGRALLAAPLGHKKQNHQKANIAATPQINKSPFSRTAGEAHQARQVLP
jgi:hypothetical protein